MPPPPPRRKGWLIGGIAGGVALILVVGGAVTWALLATPAPFSRIAGCDELLPERALATVSDVGPDDIESDRTSGEVGINDDEDAAEDGVECTTSDESEGLVTRTPLQVYVARVAPETAEDDYEEMGRHIRATRRVLGDNYDTNFSRDADPGDGADVDIEKQELQVGDGGFAFGVDDPGGDYIGYEGSGALAVFTVRNAFVHVEYLGSDGTEPAEKRDIAVDLAKAVETSVSNRSDTE